MKMTVEELNLLAKRHPKMKMEDLIGQSPRIVKRETGLIILRKAAEVTARGKAAPVEKGAVSIPCDKHEAFNEEVGEKGRNKKVGRGAWRPIRR